MRRIENFEDLPPFDYEEEQPYDQTAFFYLLQWWAMHPPFHYRIGGRRWGRSRASQERNSVK